MVIVMSARRAGTFETREELEDAIRFGAEWLERNENNYSKHTISRMRDELKEWKSMRDDFEIGGE